MINTQFVDANIFLRHFTQDNKAQSPACTALFEKAERNEVSLTTSEAILTEVVQVLSSKKTYHFPRHRVQAIMAALITLPGMKLPKVEVYKRALKLYAQEKIDFPDCLAVAHMEQSRVEEIFSYDKHFDRFEQVDRIEPATVIIQT